MPTSSSSVPCPLSGCCTCCLEIVCIGCVSTYGGDVVNGPVHMDYQILDFATREVLFTGTTGEGHPCWDGGVTNHNYEIIPIDPGAPDAPQWCSINSWQGSLQSCSGTITFYKASLAFFGCGGGGDSGVPSTGFSVTGSSGHPCSTPYTTAFPDGSIGDVFTFVSTNSYTNFVITSTVHRAVWPSTVGLGADDGDGGTTPLCAFYYLFGFFNDPCDTVSSWAAVTWQVAVDPYNGVGGGTDSVSSPHLAGSLWLALGPPPSVPAITGPTVTFTTTSLGAGWTSTLPSSPHTSTLDNYNNNCHLVRYFPTNGYCCVKCCPNVGGIDLADMELVPPTLHLTSTILGAVTLTNGGTEGEPGSTCTWSGGINYDYPGCAAGSCPPATVNIRFDLVYTPNYTTEGPPCTWMLFAGYPSHGFHEGDPEAGDCPDPEGDGFNSVGGMDPGNYSQSCSLHPLEIVLTPLDGCTNNSEILCGVCDTITITE